MVNGPRRLAGDHLEHLAMLLIVPPVTYLITSLQGAKFHGTTTPGKLYGKARRDEQGGTITGGETSDKAE